MSLMTRGRRVTYGALALLLGAGLFGGCGVDKPANPTGAAGMTGASGTGGRSGTGGGSGGGTGGAGPVGSGGAMGSAVMTGLQFNGSISFYRVRP